MVCSVYKILLVSSVAVLLFVQFSTSSPLYDGSMVIQPKTTSTNRRRFSTNTNDDNNRKIYTKTEKPVTGSENDATKSKIALMVKHFTIIIFFKNKLGPKTTKKVEATFIRNYQNNSIMILYELMKFNGIY